MNKKVPIVAIVGRANVGKSSLYNTILRRREAIVAQEAGTTRDAIWAKAQYNDNAFWLIDTAGMKTAEDDFELTIQEQIKQASESADIIWVVIEADTPITDEDRRVAKISLKSKKPVFLVVNKADKIKKTQIEDYQKLGIKQILFTSTTQNRGIWDLLEELVGVIPAVKPIEETDTIRVALLGRPNVGKSALFNALAKKQQAIVADRAGTTRDVNKTTVRYEKRAIELLDTAGIRKQGKIEKGIEHFSVLRTLSAIEIADICLLLIDANETYVQLDQKIAGMIKEANKGLILVVSKWDSLEKDAFTRDIMAKKIAFQFDFIPWAPLVFTSSVNGQNVSKLFEIITEISEAQQKLIKTADINRWLREVTVKHPPAGLKNRHPKLNYIVQEADNPTNFKVFGAHTKLLHWSYKRFMERELREKFGFAGTAVRFWFFEKHDTHKHGAKPSKHNSSSNKKSTQLNRD
ncbi:ribosome biogenesis GTPase Der [soil metagenome]